MNKIYYSKKDNRFVSLIKIEKDTVFISGVNKILSEAKNVLCFRRVDLNSFNQNYSKANKKILNQCEAFLSAYGIDYRVIDYLVMT